MRNSLAASVLEALYRAIDEVNRTLAEESRIQKSPDTVLMGPASTLESIALINLVVETEYVLQQEFSVQINLGEARAKAGDEHPFATLDSMADYIAVRIEVSA